MSVQDILKNVQTIGLQGGYQVAPKLPKPKIQPIANQTPVGPVGGTAIGQPLNSNGVPSAIDRLMSAIRGQESGGNYRAYNPTGASGAYQILRSNFENPGGWDREALGHDVSYNQFMSSPQIQDAIARYELSNYLKKFGVAGAAAAWYGGPGAVSKIHDTTAQGAYPSIEAYVKAILARM